VTKEGYLQREIKDALYVAEEKPEGTIFVIPVKLEEVEVPKRLSRWQWAKLFEEGGYQRLVRALNVQASAIGVAVAAHEVRTGEEAERKAREAEEAMLKVEAERRATREAQARETVEVKGPAPLQPAEREAKVPPATPQPNLLLEPLPLTEPEPATPSPRSRQLGSIQKGISRRVLAAALVGAAVVIIVATVAWVYWRKPPAVGTKPGESVSPVKVDQNPAASNTVQVQENPIDGLKYLWIPPGTFQMGCSPGDSKCEGDEKPSHRVTISKGFWIGQTEVTVGAYKRFAAATGREMPPAPDFDKRWANDSMPVVNVSWTDAYGYCEWAGGRLPTEAEWEYAARGGSADPRYGNLNEVAWYSNNSGGQAHEVPQKRANGFGLYDTLGNVWEWVNDWYDENYYQHNPSEDPSGPTGGEYRVRCGGSWDDDPIVVRVSNRYGFSPGFRVNNWGVRCAREVDSP
jgi:formylglycine-generating enzyme required for sulfatase activity